MLARVLLCGLLASCGASQRSRGQDCAGGRIWHDDDMARLRGCSVVVGDLELGGALRSAAGLERLVRVEGRLVIGPSYQLDDTAALRRLRHVADGLELRRNAVLEGVYLPELVTLGGELVVEHNPNLRRLSTPRYERSATRERLVDNPMLESEKEMLGGAPASRANGPRPAR